MKKRSAIAALLLMNFVKTKRRYWVRPIIKNRGRKGNFELLVTELMKEDSEWFYKYIRMDPDSFQLVTCVFSSGNNTKTAYKFPASYICVLCTNSINFSSSILVFSMLRLRQ